MNFSKIEQTPDNPDDLPPARRRRAQRLLAPLDTDERQISLLKLRIGLRLLLTFIYFPWSPDQF